MRLLDCLIVALPLLSVQTALSKTMKRKRRHLVLINETDISAPKSLISRTKVDGRDLETSTSELEHLFQQRVFTSEMSMVAIPIETVNDFNPDFKTETEADAKYDTVNIESHSSNGLMIGSSWWIMFIPALWLVMN